MPPRTSKPTIKALIVEDDHAMRGMALHCLNNHPRLNIEKHLAEDMHDGLREFQRQQPQLVFLDITLPDGSGLDLLEKLHKLAPNAFIIMLTQSSLAEDVQLAKLRGAHGYITKPFNTSQLHGAADACFRHLRRLGLRDAPSDNEAASAEEEGLIEFAGPGEEQEDPIISGIVKKWKVLFADRSTANCKRARLKLLDVCHVVDTASSVKELSGRMLEHNYHLVFLDTGLPEGNSYRFAHELAQMEKHQTNKTRMVAMLNNLEEFHNKKWQLAGMHDYIVKPCSVRELKACLRKHARHQRKIDGEEFVA